MSTEIDDRDREHGELVIAAIGAIASRDDAACERIMRDLAVQPEQGDGAEGRISQAVDLASKLGWPTVLRAILAKLYGARVCNLAAEVVAMRHIANILNILGVEISSQPSPSQSHPPTDKLN